ncbi:MAG: hypothetical protein IIC08_02585 [Proteobacteria bacterium]|nr:hypothetical protein [Pseudomonadota bacterium]
MNQRDAGDQPFRFFDNREKYLMFVTTCSEKQVSAERIGGELDRLKPRPPAVRLFDAGMGDGTVLSMVLRDCHQRWPTSPFLVVGKEISREDMRLTTGKLADRFYEHPQMVIALTNMFYSEAPYLFPNRPEAQAQLNWREVALTGNSTHQFDAQIKAQDGFITDGWRTRPSPKTGNPLYVKPSVLVLYREDQRFALDAVIPRRGQRDFAYDMVIVSQPYRARSSAALKVRNVLAPLARSLAPGGRMITIQSTGRDPGMEIIRKVWPDEDPFQTPRGLLLETLREQLGDDARGFVYDHETDAEFRYHLQLADDELGNNIGTSTLLAAWNAATYVAQIEDHRLARAMSRSAYLEATQSTLTEHGGLWFLNECFVVARNL